MNIANLENKYGRAFVSLNDFISKKYKNLKYKELEFSLFRGLLYEFFENNNIFISVYPFEFNNPRWTYRINIDSYEIIDGDYSDKFLAEYVAFDKCFQFLDTRLFVKDIHSNLHEDSSDIEVLKFNWKHLDNVLKSKRQKNKI
jgi:hypothetical protein